MTQPDRFHRRYQYPYQVVEIGGRRFGLGRGVNHDPASRAYPYRSSAAALDAVFYERHIPIFDQGELGSCTANAGLGVLSCDPYWSDWSAAQQSSGPITRYAWVEQGAVAFYEDITADDDIDGQYPPDDTGSNGLSVGKEMVKRGIVPGYQHTFNLSDAMAGLMEFPLLVGTVWTENMFYPDSLGRIPISGAVAGGHEWYVDEYVPAGAKAITGSVLSKSEPMLGATTSWTASFGVDGRFYVSVANFKRLLAQDGDVMILTPPTAPAPEPEPTPEPSDLTAADVAGGIRNYLSGLGL